jgi:2-polyprenyl-3-methyl-5-hydroxy-6-metoxy-1,4-benzoquinol methylase
MKPSAVKTYSSIPRGERSVEAVCPLCGGSAYAVWLAEEGFRFVRCRACSLVYQNPRPLLEDLRKRYDSAYFTYEIANERAFLELIGIGLKDIDFDRIAESFPPPRRFLDVGCATGMLVEEMGRRGWQARGADLCRESAEYGMERRGVIIDVGTLEEARYPDGSFEAVHFSHLIEHVPDPRGFLLEVKRILVPGGLAVITTPNIEGLQARIFRGRWRSAIADHLTLFGMGTLSRLLTETGFRLEKKVTWGGLARGIGPGFIKKPLDYLAKKWGFGDVMLLLARCQ